MPWRRPLARVLERPLEDLGQELSRQGPHLRPWHFLGHGDIDVGMPQRLLITQHQRPLRPGPGRVDPLRVALHKPAEADRDMQEGTDAVLDEKSVLQLYFPLIPGFGVEPGTAACLERLLLLVHFPCLLCRRGLGNCCRQHHSGAEASWCQPRAGCAGPARGSARPNTTHLFKYMNGMLTIPTSHLVSICPSNRSPSGMRP